MAYFVLIINYELGLFVLVYEKLNQILGKTYFLTVGIK